MDSEITEDEDSVSSSYDIVDPLEFFPQIPNSTRTFLHREADFQRVFDVLVQQKIYLEKRWSILNRVLDDDACVIHNPSTEQKFAALFNEIFKAAVKTNPDWVNAWSLCAWRSHAIQGMRKPNVVLVKRHLQHDRPVTFGDIVTYCEVKKQSNGVAIQNAWRQIAETAGLVLARQANRRFFIGLSICGAELRLALYARGAIVSSKPFNINNDPLLFIKVILNLSCVDSVCHGFDENFIDLGQGNFELYVADLKVLVTPVKLFHVFFMKGRGTKVSLCSEPSGNRYYVLKDRWLLEGPTDIDIHDHLASQHPKPFTNMEEASIFGEYDKFNIFRGCSQMTSVWDYDVNLPGIPIIAASEIPRCRNPSGIPQSQDGTSQQRCADTTQHVLSRFTTNLTYKARTHVRVLSATCGTSLAWFSCRREFLNGLMCAIAGHFNGLRKNVLHRDISDANVWFVVSDLDVQSVIPDWPQDGTYTKRAAVLGEWGSAEIRDPSRENYILTGTVTDTYPFLASELLSDLGLKGEVCHEVHHDLESFFWLLWITCVNLNGPYLHRRLWDSSSPSNSGASQHPSTQSLSLSRRHARSSQKSVAVSLRHPCDAVASDAVPDVPAWATPGDPHSCTPREVHRFKYEIPVVTFVASLSPYFSDGPAAKPFVNGLMRLREYFAWTVKDGEVTRTKDGITHEIFIQILQQMRDSIAPGDDCPTEQDIIRGRQSYQTLVDSGRDFDLPVMQEATPVPSQSRSTLKGDTSRGKRSRTATEDPSQDIPTPNQHLPGPAKRRRT